MVDIVTLYERIKHLADARGMSISKVERYANLGSGTIGGWNKQNAQPTIGSVKAVAAVFSISIDQLIRDVE